MPDSSGEANSFQSPLMERAQILMEIRGYQSLDKRREGGVTDITALDPGSEGKVLIRVKPAGRAGRDSMRRMVSKVEEGGFHNGVLISQRATAWAKRMSDRKGVELFTDKSLPAFNIFKHNLVPKHEILSQSEALRVMRMNRIKPFELPHVSASDPAIRLIGGRPGDVVKITRNSPTSGKAVFYRHVIPDKQ